MPTRSPKALLIRKVELICGRLVVGGTADRRWQVKAHQTLRIASIVLTSLGGAGFIADKVNSNLPGQTGWAFWGGVILLAFGIVTQIANELGVERVATQARAAAETFKLLSVRLDLVLEQPDPRDDVARLHADVRAATEKYHATLPDETATSQRDARALTQKLARKYQAIWSFSDSD